MSSHFLFLVTTALKKAEGKEDRRGNRGVIRIM
jgi:hypothetical protein